MASWLDSHLPKSALAVGDRVRLLPQGAVGVVCSVGVKGVRVRVGSVTVRVAAHVLERLPSERKPVPQPPRKPPPNTGAPAVFRTAANTIDLHGLRVEEALECADRFLASSLAASRDVVFFCHGHGTGALKKGLRTWLASHPLVCNWAPADMSQGGDAFTWAVLAD